MLDQASGDDLLQATVYDTDGNKIGRVGRVYLDDQSDRPEWVTVQTGLFGTKETFLPLGQGRLDGDRLVVPIAKDAVKDAPHIDPDSGHLSVEEEQRLYQHYGLSHGQDASADDDASATDDSGFAGGPASGHYPAPGEGQAAAAAPTAAESPGPAGQGDPMCDRGDRGTEGDRAQSGLRLRRHVVTEQQQITVPVTREEYILEGDEPSGQGTEQDRPDDPPTQSPTHPS